MHLRDSFSNQFIFFGTRDDELYTYNLSTECYQAIEYVGESEWNAFSNAEEMLKFMLKRALD